MRRRHRHSCAVAIVLLVYLSFLAGCGSSEEGRESDFQRSSSAPAANDLRKSFPEPKPASGANQRSAEAIETGRSACEGKTPIQVKDEAYAEAKSSLDEGQRRLVGELPDYEAEAEGDPDFVAGQIAATVYAATLPEAVRPLGFQGCVYELARTLEGELAGT